MIVIKVVIYLSYYQGHAQQCDQTNTQCLFSDGNYSPRAV